MLIMYFNVKMPPDIIKIKACALNFKPIAIYNNILTTHFSMFYIKLMAKTWKYHL